MRGGEEEKGATYNTVCTLTETVILQTISSGNGPFSFFCSRSRHVAISSINTQTSFCAGVECEGGAGEMCGDVHVWRGKGGTGERNLLVHPQKLICKASAHIWTHGILAPQHSHTPTPSHTTDSAHTIRHTVSTHTHTVTHD